MAKAEATVAELVGMIERGELRLPEMQRGYVWRATHVRDLLDSLYRGYPSGSILLWDTEEEVALQGFALEQSRPAVQRSRLLLDGQQRLTSLAAVMSGKPLKVRGRSKPIEILFNLNHPDELPFASEVYEDDEQDASTGELQSDTPDDELQERFERLAFVVATRKLAALPHWVRVTDVFNGQPDHEILKRAGITRFDDPLADRYFKRLANLRRISEYVYRMDILERQLTYTQVTDIFVRVNSLGAKLRSSDLALAQITAKWTGSLEEFQTFQNATAKQGYDLDLGLHLKNLVAFATDQSKFHTVGRLSLGKLQEAWKQSMSGMATAVNFLKANAGIESPALLSSPFICIVVGYYYHVKGRVSASEMAELKSWVLLANAKGRYSRGSSETLLDQDIATLRNGGSPSDLIDRLRQQVGILHVSPQELEGRTQRSALFKTMFMSFKRNGARDWKSNLAIALDHRGSQHTLQFHHIFPKANLRKLYPMREIDDLANLAFIGGGENRRISNKPADSYLPDVLATQGSQALISQAIPLDPELWRLENYPRFLTARRIEIAKQLNEFLGNPEAATSESL